MNHPFTETPLKARHLVAIALLAPFAASTFANDALRTLLEDSKASGKGVNLYVNGQTIPAVVVAVDDRYVLARSQSQGAIVIRLERLDGASGFVSGERKAQ